MGALARKDNLKQLKKLRSLTKGIDAGDKIKKITDKYYDGTNGATLKNAIDGYIDSYEDHYKKTSKKTNDNKMHNYKSFINEKHNKLNYYVFIEENEFDEYGEPENGVEIGYSTLNVYALDEHVDEHDNDYISDLLSSISDMEPIGTAKIKFLEGEDTTEILEVSNGIDINSITLLYPTL